MRLRTLGGLDLIGAKLTRPKPLLLLAYLSLEGPKERRYLTELFWPRAKNPADSLAVALSQIRRGAPGAVWESSGRIGTGIETDVEALAQKVAAGAWKEVIELAPGPFLAGLRLRLDTELEEWVYAWRERIDGWVAEAHLALAEAALAQGRKTTAQGHAEAAYVRLLGGSAPVPERVIKILRATGSARVQGPATPPPPCRLPTPSTPMVGRRQELAELWARFEEGCRWVTVVGLGGVGKTRLALAFAQEACQRRAFADGVFWIDLENVEGSLVEALASGLGHAPGRGRPGWPLLASTIGERQILVVLDGINPRESELEALSDWLRACPGLRVLATARRRIGLEAEWAVPLTGLSLDPAGPEGLSEAARLFFIRARQVGTRELEPAAVEALCRATDGHPLAIELSASWTPVLPPEEIAKRIVQEGGLSPRYPGLPGHRRSLAEVIQASVRLLPEKGQRAFRRLAVFAGGFTPTAAEAIGAADPEDLALLADRALLSQRRRRLYLHPLLAAHAGDLLRARTAEMEQLRLRHARYYLASLAGLDGLPPHQLARLAREQANLRKAWQTAAAAGLWKELGEARLAVRLFFDNLGRFAEGLDWIETALRHRPPEPLADLLALDRAWFLVRLGRLAEAEAATPATPREDPAAERWRRFTLGLLAYRRGAHREAETHWRAVLKEPGDTLGLRARHNLALAIFAQGRLEEARRLLNQALSEALAQRNLVDAVRVRNNLGNLLRILHREEEAKAMLTQGLAEAHRLDLGQLKPFLLYNLGQVALNRGLTEEALARFRQARAAVERTGERVLEASCCINLGRTHQRRGHLAEAESWIRQGLALAWQVGELPEVLRGLVALAELRAAEGQKNEAARLLTTVVEHPATRGHNREQAARLLDRLPAEKAYPSLEAALEAQGLALAYPPLTGKG